MPKRSRSHQLEDISIQEFERLLPDAWVSRRKGKDYGVDMEVEVFDDDGQSTGLMFLVQLKATDDIDKARKVSMKVDRLDYLASLDTPSMVVRYCKASCSFHWIWLTNIFARIPPPDTETVTIKFETSDAWGDDTAKAIPRTLHIYRTMRLGARRAVVGLEMHNEDVDANTAFALNHAVSRVLNLSNRFISSADPKECLPIQVGLKGDILYAEIDAITSIRVVLHSIEPDAFFTQLVYFIAHLVRRAKFDDQLYELATTIRRDDLKCGNRLLASSVASAVVGKPDLAAAIASLNALHNEQDIAFARYIHALLDHPVSHMEKAPAINMFYREAIAAHEGQSMQTQAALHYSFGNSLRIAFDLPSALRQFNLARKKNPEYLERAYFLGELGSTLYFLKRFRLSSQAYTAAYAIEATPKHAICVGDALLFSGAPHRAEEFYENAVVSDDHFEAAEGYLKVVVAVWIKEFKAENAEVKIQHLSRPDFWMDVMERGIKEARYDYALYPALILSFSFDDDPGAWTNAIQLAVQDRDPELMIATLSCAIGRCGYDAYSQFRDMLVAQGFSEDYVQPFDQLASAIHDKRSGSAPKELTMRHFVPQLIDRAGS